MDRTAKITGTNENDETASAPADWRWLGAIGLRCYFAGPAEIDAAALTIEGCGVCRAFDSDQGLPDGFNLIGDPGFDGGGKGWRTDWGGPGTVRLESGILPVQDGRSSASRGLAIQLPRADNPDRHGLTLAYVGTRSDGALSARPGARYRFDCTIDGDCAAKLGIEFLDGRGRSLGREERAYPAARAKGVPGGCVVATAPPGSAEVVCEVVLLVAGKQSDEDAGLYLSDPSLRVETGDAAGRWAPETLDHAAFRAAMGDPQSRIFYANRDPALPLGQSGSIDVHRDGAGQPVVAGPASVTEDTNKFAFRPIKGDLIEIRVAGFSGPLLLAIDGQVVDAKHPRKSAKPLPVRLRVPTRLLDGDHHLLQLIDGKSLALLGSDIAYLGDRSVDWASLRDHAMPPYPAHLSPKSARRMEAMRRQLAWFGARETLDEDDRWLLGHLDRIGEILTTGFARNRDFFPLRFPTTPQPEVSIVIPVHGQYAATFHCLCSLLYARNETRFEVIVVDDGSPDDTAEQLALHDGIRIVSRPESGGFIAACNDGAAGARGEYVLFLNNDCEVTPGWLDELVASFAIFPGTGAACPQLLHADGRLQVAGTIVWKNGKPQNVGWNQNPRDPRYGYSRDTDYLAGAALITLKSLWDEIGGFAEELSPAYFEDTWYSFAVREAGYRTIYCATSAVYHTRGVSNGVDPDEATSVKRFQSINHPKFKRRWHEAYQEHGAFGGDPMLEKDRGAKKRLLMIGWRVPRPDQDAGSYSTVQEMKMFQALGCKVTFLPTNLEYGGRYTEALQRIGVECLHAPFATSVVDLLAERRGEFDLVLVSRYTIMRPLIQPIRNYAPKAKLLLNIEDLNFVREMRRAIAGGDAEGEQAAHALRSDELQVIRNADLVLSYSSAEVAILQGLIGSKPTIGKLPWVEEARPGPSSFGERSGLCFLGSHQHPPNAEAVEAFASRIAPGLDGAEQVLHVYGSQWPSDADFDSEHISIEGFAPHIAATFNRHRVFVAPLTSGAGVKGKVLLAMAHGLPTVLSPIAAEGIELQPGIHCLIAEKPAEWAAAIGRLSSDEALWTEIRDAALGLIERNYAREDGIEKLRDLLESVDIFL